MTKVYVAFFGLIGIFGRYFLGWLLSQKIPVSFPVGTFAINILGSFLIGAVYAMGVEKHVLSEPLRVGLMIGLLGGFTTFSSFSLETVRLFERAEYATALSYFLLSPILGLGAAAAGLAAARFLIPA